MDQTQRMPKGVPYIIGNEAAERFSYYGMRAILVVYMTQYLVNAQGQSDFMGEQEANVWYHNFASAVYFFPILGALLADIFFGKYKVIMWLSLLYCVGHFVLAVFEVREGLFWGLAFIAMGAGGIKPCVSAHVGDQFNESNKGLISKVFGWFYFSINFGSFFSTLLTPWMLKNHGPAWAFGIPGILMAIATLMFYIGRKKFISMPPVGFKKYFEVVWSPQGKKALLNLSIFFVLIAPFWSLFEQQGSSWIIQAEKMNRTLDLRFGPFQYDWLQMEFLSSQLHAINPVFVMMLIPLFTAVIYPKLSQVVQVTALRKIFVGFFFAGASFGVLAYVQHLIVGGATPTFLWQILAFFLITIAEILISITALEFSYTQAPNAMKSVVMGIYMLSISLGNLIASAVNAFIGDAKGPDALIGPGYFLFFVALCTGMGLVFGIYARFYKEEAYTQDHSLALKE